MSFCYTGNADGFTLIDLKPLTLEGAHSDLPAFKCLR